MFVRNWAVVFHFPWEPGNVDMMQDVRTASNDPTEVVKMALKEELGSSTIADLYSRDELTAPVIVKMVRDPRHQERRAEVDVERAMGYESARRTG